MPKSSEYLDINQDSLIETVKSFQNTTESIQKLVSEGKIDLAKTLLNEHIKNLEQLYGSLANEELSNIDRTEIFEKVIPDNNSDPDKPSKFALEKNDIPTGKMRNRNYRSRVCNDAILIHLDNNHETDIYLDDLKSELDRLGISEAKASITNRIARMRKEKEPSISPKDFVKSGIYRISPAGRKLVKDSIRKDYDLNIPESDEGTEE